MRKVKLVSVLASLTFTAVVNWSVPAPANANEIVNGDFNGGAISWLTGTSQHNLVGGSLDGDTTALIGGSSTLQKNEFQYVNAALLSNGSANPNWLPGAASETYTFSYQYDIKGSPTRRGRASDKVRNTQSSSVNLSLIQHPHIRIHHTPRRDGLVR